MPHQKKKVFSTVYDLFIYFFVLVTTSLHVTVLTVVQYFVCNVTTYRVTKIVLTVLYNAWIDDDRHAHFIFAVQAIICMRRT